MIFNKGRFFAHLFKLRYLMKEIGNKNSKKFAGIKGRVMPFGFLSVILLFHLINNYIWLKLDNTYLLFDSHNHFLFSLRALEGIKNNIIPILPYSRWHGLFTGYLTSPFYLFFGSSQDAGAMINSTIFLTILVLSTYGIGKKLLNEKAGILSAFILTMYPLIFNQLRVYMLDIPLTAMVTLSIFLLLLTENFANKKYSLLFAVSAGLGMLTKFNFLGFIAGPLSIVLYKAFSAPEKETKLRFRQKGNILIIFFLATAILLPFYMLKFREIFARIYACSWFHVSKYYPGLSFPSLMHEWLSIGWRFILWFIKDSINNSVTFLFFCAFLIGLPVFFMKKTCERNILLLWALLPLFCLSFIFHYPAIDRYIMPILPPIAIISGLGITSIRYAKLRRIIISLLILIGCFQYFAISYNMRLLPEKLELPPSKGFFLFNRKIAMNYRYSSHGFSYPSLVNWRSEEILNEIVKDRANPKHKRTVFFISAIPQVYEPIVYLNFLKKYQLVINAIFLQEEELYKDRDSPIYMLLSADYVIMKKEEKFENTIPPFAKERIKETRELFKQNVAMFSLMREFKLEDGSTLLIFKRKEEYAKITRWPLEFYFRSGVTKLYYNGVEVTNNLGLETLFNYGGETYSSAQAIWGAKRVGDKRIIATARWRGLPFSQEWEFDIRNSKSIGWKVTMDAPKKVDIKDRVSALALSEMYKEWLMPPGKSKISYENTFIFKKIILPQSIYDYVGVCGFKKMHLPTIVFQPTVGQFKVTPIMQWRNNLRIIKFIATDTKTASSPRNKNFSFFSGDIIIEDDEY